MRHLLRWLRRQVDHFVQLCVRLITPLLTQVLRRWDSSASLLQPTALSAIFTAVGVVCKKRKNEEDNGYEESFMCRNKYFAFQFSNWMKLLLLISFFNKNALPSSTPSRGTNHKLSDLSYPHIHIHTMNLKWNIIRFDQRTNWIFHRSLTLLPAMDQL